MRLENYILPKGNLGAAGLFFACGSFGNIDGEVDYCHEKTENQEIYSYTNGKIILRAEFYFEKNGVVVRKDYFHNISEETVEINSLLSRFRLDGNDYDVYTQFNGWQHESWGDWQKLVTEVSAKDVGMRGCDGATPMMALHNNFTGKNTVFHIMPSAQWQITARKFPQSTKEAVIVEAGFYETGLQLKVAPGEIIALPEIIFFNAESKIDLDAYKLHRWYNEKYPRKAMPVLYNSWLYCFDIVNIDELLKQVDCAAELGFEAFMVDAGWFGKGEDWYGSVGDWSENMTSGPAGRLSELSEKVREKGMIFGLWFEPERAGVLSDAIKNHPELFMENAYLDFSNPNAVDYIVDAVSSQIEKYKLGWIKFDFNATIPHDPHKEAYLRYHQGQKEFVRRLKEKYPDLYITNCASGGFRMELEQGTFCDSFWLTDNQGPFVGAKVVKNTLKRMPTSLIERWNVQAYCENFFRSQPKPEKGLMFTCNDASWDFIVHIDDSFTKCFLTGGPMGFTCELDNISEKYHEMWKNMIADHKKNREFFMNSCGRVLIDSDPITLIQYSDYDLSRLVLHFYTKVTYSADMIIYPVVNKEFTYQVMGETRTGEDIMENGIRLSGFKDYSCQEIEIVKV